MSVPRRETPRSAPRVALVTCAELPAGSAEVVLLIDALRAIGVEAAAAVWDDPAVDWASFDLSVVRSCWDYASRRADFLRWSARVPRLCNPAHVLAWNTDKRYLAELAGLPVVPTYWIDSSGDWSAQRHGLRECVIKPTVSLSALDTGRYDLTDAGQRHLADLHVHRLQRAGRTAMVQPYQSRIDSEGEISLVFMNGSFSHAVHKGPLLTGPDEGIDRRFIADGGLTLQPYRPDAAQLEIAQRALAAAPGDEPMLYARVDVVPDDDGAPQILELELTEPQLFLDSAPGALHRFAAAIATRCTGEVVTDGIGMESVRSA